MQKLIRGLLHHLFARDETIHEGIEGKPTDCLDIELGSDILAMAHDSIHTDIQGISDFLIGQSTRDLRKDFKLSGGETLVCSTAYSVRVILKGIEKDTLYLPSTPATVDEYARLIVGECIRCGKEREKGNETCLFGPKQVSIERQ